MPEPIDPTGIGAAAAPLPPAPVDPTPVDPDDMEYQGHNSLWGNARKKLKKSVSFWFGLVVLVLVFAMAAIPGAISTKDPRACKLDANVRSGPSAEHWFGIDEQGCDYFSRVVHGTRNSLAIGVFAMLIVLVVGVVLGVLAGYFGGWWDSVLSRVTDVFFGIPLILGAMLLLSVLHNRSIWTVSLALAAFGWMTAMRLVRSSVVAIRDAEYVQAAKAVGVSTPRILIRHIFPNAVGPVIVWATIAIGGMIAAEATLTFLGIGLQAPTMSWGLQISIGQKFFIAEPHLVAFPALLLSLTVLAFMLLGEALRDALDPRGDRS